MMTMIDQTGVDVPLHPLLTTFNHIATSMMWLFEDTNELGNDDDDDVDCNEDNDDGGMMMPHQFDDDQCMTPY